MKNKLNSLKALSLSSKELKEIKGGYTPCGPQWSSACAGREGEIHRSGCICAPQYT